MTLTDLASIGNFVSGVAVVVSLIYLALQVRLARHVQQAFMHQARVDRVTTASLGFLQPEVAATIAKASNHPDAMSAQEIMQLIYFMRIQITAHEDAMWQGEAGFLDEQARETTFLTTRRLLGNPVLRAIWHIVRGQCAPNVRAHIEKLESESPLLPPHDWARVWKAAYDKVKAEHA